MGDLPVEVVRLIQALEREGVGTWWALGGHMCMNYVLHIRRDAPLLWSAAGQEPVDLIFAPTLSAIRHHSVISTSTRKYQLMLPIGVAKVEPIA